jgi:hypothetical protein
MQSKFSIEDQDITSTLKVLYNSKLHEILDNISDKYGILNTTLYKDYLIDDLDLAALSCSAVKKKRKKNKVLAACQLCLARKADGERCTRRKKESVDFCGKHSGNLKYGRIDDTDQHPSESFIQCSSITIDGDQYLIDNKKVVYSYNIDNPEIIGGLNTDGKLIKIDKIDKIVNSDE